MGGSLEIGWTTLPLVGVQQSALQEGNRSLGKISHSLELQEHTPGTHSLRLSKIISPFSHVFAVYTGELARKNKYLDVDLIKCQALKFLNST